MSSFSQIISGVILDVQFFKELAKRKLEDDKLSENVFILQGDIRNGIFSVHFTAENGDLDVKLKIFNRKDDMFVFDEEGFCLATHVDAKHHVLSFILAVDGDIKRDNSVDFTSLLCPKALISQASKLNLKLITWRLAPGIDLKKFEDLRVVIVGSGTLGCMVSRLLLQWGVLKFTFIDNGKVIPSNPVRQCLFDVNDLRKEKAQAAAEAITRIHPSAECKHISMTIPMPGIPGLPSLENDVDTLENAIVDSDVVFLLTDTRESRWLPALLGAVHGKLVIAAALGFDTWTVVHHGEGCYFCHDPQAPGDSTIGRTLDQACTVTRAGCSAAASSTAVELMASLIQKGHLGDAPHMIRGSLRTFEQTTLTINKNAICSCCSENVIACFREHGSVFIRAISNDRSILDKISGAEQMLKDALAIEVFEFE